MEIKNKVWLPLSLLIWVLCIVSALRTQYEDLILAALVLLIYLAAFYQIEDKTKIAWLVLIALGLHTVLFSEFPSRSLTFYLDWLTAFLFFLSLRTLAADRSSHHIQTLRISYLVVILPICLLMLYSFAQNPIRTKVLFFQDFNQNALAILVCLLFAYTLIKSNIAIFITLVISSAAIFVTDSRSVTFLLVFALSAIGLYERNSSVSLKKWWCAVAACSLSYLFIDIYPNIKGLPLEGRDFMAQIGTLNSRTIFWSVAMDDILTRPWLGHGIGNFELLSIRQHIPDLGYGSPHNDYLRIWLGFGAFWAIAFVSAVAAVVYTYNPLRWTFNNRENLVAYLVIICFAMYMTVNYIIGQPIFLLLFAMSLAQLQSQRGRSQ